MILGIYDHVLPFPANYREVALQASFRSLSFGAVTFHGIAPAPDDQFERWLEAKYPRYEATVSFLRQSPEGQVEPNFIHTDTDMGDLTALLYLSCPPAEGDGTLFWQSSATRQREGAAFGGPAGEDTTGWVTWQKVRARWNRAVVFSSNLFHSRALRENYGVDASARLVQVCFATRRQ